MAGLRNLCLLAHVQEPPLDFPGAVPGQFLNDDEVNGNLLRAEKMSNMLAQRLCVSFIPLLAHNEIGDRLLTIDRIWSSHCRGFSHRGIGKQSFFDFTRGNVFTSAVDHLTQATLDKQIAIRVVLALVAITNPTILKRLLPLVFVICVDDAWPRDTYFTDFSRVHITQLFIVLLRSWVTNAQRHTDREASRSRLTYTWWNGISDDLAGGF
jgi:hypothetical protein